MRRAHAAFLIACLAASSLHANERTAAAGGTFELKSKVLGETRPYSVYLPAVCNTQRAATKCLILYILDGESSFSLGSAILQKMIDNAQVPPLMMVAIPNTTDRTRDLTPTHSLDDGFGKEDQSRATSGGGERFLNFIEQELIPEVERRYQPLPYRVLVGHSFGGLFTAHSLVTRPTLFQAHIAIDSSLYWDHHRWLDNAEAALNKLPDIRNRVYLSVAEPEGDIDQLRRMGITAKRFMRDLSSNPSPNLKSHLQFFPGEDHGSVVLPSLYYGLKFIFEGYKDVPPAVARQGSEAVGAYYRNYLGPYGIELPAPQAVLWQLASAAEAREHFSEAIAFRQYDVKLNPSSAAGHFFLAQTYRQAGEKSLAASHYRKAMALDEKMSKHVTQLLMNLESAQ